MLTLCGEGNHSSRESAATFQRVRSIQSELVSMASTLDGDCVDCLTHPGIREDDVAYLGDEPGPREFLRSIGVEEAIYLGRYRGGR